MNQYIKTGAQLGKISLQSLLISRLEILEPPLFWLQIRMRLSAEFTLRTRNRKNGFSLRVFPVKLTR